MGPKVTSLGAIAHKICAYDTRAFKRDSLAHGFDPFLVRSVKTARQVPFDNFFAD
jgi:hypothetical protein